MSETPAGWYPNPENPTQLRLWDGTAWTQDSPDPEPASSDLAGLVFDEFTDSGVLVTPTEFWTVR